MEYHKRHERKITKKYQVSGRVGMKLKEKSIKNNYQISNMLLL